MNKVHCDGCGRDIEVKRLEDIKEYYNKECENCGSILVNDMDMEVLLSLLELKTLGMVSEGSEETPEGMVRARVSTIGGELRITELNDDADEPEVTFAEDTSWVDENGRVRWHNDDETE